MQIKILLLGHRGGGGSIHMYKSKIQATME